MITIIIIKLIDVITITINIRISVTSNTFLLGICNEAMYVGKDIKKIRSHQLSLNEFGNISSTVVNMISEDHRRKMLC